MQFLWDNHISKARDLNFCLLHYRTLKIFQIWADNFSRFMSRHPTGEIKLDKMYGLAQNGEREDFPPSS